MGWWNELLICNLVAGGVNNSKARGGFNTSLYLQNDVEYRPMLWTVTYTYINAQGCTSCRRNLSYKNLPISLFLSCAGGAVIKSHSEHSQKQCCCTIHHYISCKQYSSHLEFHHFIANVKVYKTKYNSFATVTTLQQLLMNSTDLWIIQETTL